MEVCETKRWQLPHRRPEVGRCVNGRQRRNQRRGSHRVAAVGRQGRTEVGPAGDRSLQAYDVTCLGSYKSGKNCPSIFRPLAIGGMPLSGGPSESEMTPSRKT